MSKSGGNMGHEEYKPYENLHLSVGRFDGGQCLGAHEYYYKQYDSCSYRWQAAHRATTSDRALYAGQHGKTGISAPAPSTASNFQRNRALARDPGPETTSEEGRVYQLVTGVAFRTAFSPWPNNPHHLIPDAQLKNVMIELTKDVPEMRRVIVQGLLESKYNLNHWENMMILPQEDKIGCLLELPTHPAGDDHRQYSAEVRLKLKEIFLPYRVVVKQVKAGESHDELDPLELKQALIGLSRTLHGAVIAARPQVRARCADKRVISINSFRDHVKTILGV